MEEHPPLFPHEELNGLPTLPEAVHENIVPFSTPAAIPEAGPTQPAREVLVPVFNPAEIVASPAPENTELSLTDAVAKYKMLVGVKPDSDLTEAHIREVISNLDNAEKENQRIRDLEAIEHAKELAEQSKGWR